MGKPAGGVRKPATKRTEVVEPLFAHVAAEGVLFKVRSWGFRRPLPALSRVSLPGAGGIVAIDVSVPAAVNIVLVECVPCYRCFRNMSVEVAIVAAHPLDTAVIKDTARVRVEVGAPIMRPFPAVPGVESIVMLDMHYAWSPMVVNVDMIETDV